MKNKQLYNFSQLAYAVLMAFALLWLTISAPFVYSHQQKIAKQNRIAINTCNSDAGTEEEAATPFGNNTEEKVPDGNSFSEEYLHNHDQTDYFSCIILPSRICEKKGVYIAFHGEILVPPPIIA